MASQTIAFIDCTSLSFSYDIMGIVTVSYTVVHNVPEYIVFTKIEAGTREFTGHVINATFNPIPATEGWYETYVTVIAMTD